MAWLIRDDGARLRIKLPVLLLGAGEIADERLDGLADLHCLLTPTPAGPALRSFAPQATLVNGEPTAAALLKDGDVVELGSHRFAISWTTMEAQASPIHEFLAERTTYIETMMSKLAEEREAVRAEKGSLKSNLAEIQAKRRETRKVHARTRVAAAKLLKEHRVAVQVERRAMREEQSLLCAQRQQFEHAREQFTAEHERFRGEAELSNQRIAAAWAAMTASQQQLASERTRTEQELAVHLNLLDARKVDAEKREAALDANAKAATEKLAALQSEVAELEQRASQTRMMLADLDHQRAQKTPVEPARVEAGDWSTPVPLTRHDTRTADQLLVQLRQQEQEVAKERQRLAVQLQHAATEREHLHDQRALVAEQIRQLEATRRNWQTAEGQTLSELEHLGTSLALRESQIEARANAVALAERERKLNEEKLGDFRKTLEDWRSALTAQETQFVAYRKRIEADLSRHRSELAKRETDVGSFFARWDHQYAEACAALYSELEHFSEAKATLNESIREIAKSRDTALAELQRITVKSLAFEEAKAAFVKDHGPTARRTLRIAKRRWMARLAQSLHVSQTQQTACEAALLGAVERLGLLQKGVASAADHRAAALAVARGRERAVLLNAGEEPVILPIADARRAPKRAEDEGDVIPLQRAA